MSKLNFQERSDLAKSLQKHSLDFYEMHHLIQRDNLMSTVTPPLEKQQLQVVQIANNKRVMIDQMFKTILRGFRNFYRKLYKVY